MEQSFLRQQSGSIAVIGGIAIAGLFAVISVSITSADGWALRSKAQAHLDAAVIAGAAIPGVPKDEDRVRVAELTYLANKSARADSGADVEILRQAPGTFKVNGTIVSGQVTFKMKSAFLAFLGYDGLSVTVASAAEILHGTPVCVLGLDPNESETIDMNGRASVDVVDCAAMANSLSGSGINQVGQGRMRAKDIGVTGGFTGTNYEPLPVKNVPPIPDPLADLPMPVVGACHPLSGAKLQQVTRTLTPGTYCGGLQIKSSSVVRLEPGDYIFKDGPLWIDSQSSVSGDEVLLAFLGEGASLYIYAGGVLSVTSPTRGTYANIQFFGDRNVYGAKQESLYMTVIGDSRLSYDGVLYMPAHHVWWAGGSVVEGRSPSYAAIAKKLWFQDNTQTRLMRKNDRGLDVDEVVTLTTSARLIR